MSDVLKKLTREMEKVQEPKRFVHTLGVEYTAAALAAGVGGGGGPPPLAGRLMVAPNVWEMINCCQPARNTTFR